MEEKIVVGWREFLSLPDLGIDTIKAKVDTGAKTSCLHAFQLEPFDKNGEAWIRFWIHPKQKDVEEVITCEAKIIDERVVRDSGGHEEKRFVIQSTIELDKQRWSVELTLTNRENMAFRMLLGRTAMTNRIIVDPTQSFLVSMPENGQ
jgi:hypothetical protein